MVCKVKGGGLSQDPFVASQRGNFVRAFSRKPPLPTNRFLLVSDAPETVSLPSAACLLVKKTKNVAENKSQRHKPTKKKGASGFSVRVNLGATFPTVTPLRKPEVTEHNTKPDNSSRLVFSRQQKGHMFVVTALINQMHADDVMFSAPSQRHRVSVSERGQMLK